MPAIFLDNCTHLKGVLELIDFLPPHKWLISNLECYDYCNWDGCEKWAEELLILTDEELKKDVYLRDMQFVWGVFSAIPANCDNEKILRYELPYCENPCYHETHIVPQHPLALLEINFFDSGGAYICAHDAEFLKPFYSLPFEVRDEEEDNCRINAEKQRIRDAMRKVLPDLSDEVANEVSLVCWWALFRDKTSEVSDEDLTQGIQKALERVSATKHRLSNP